MFVNITLLTLKTLTAPIGVSPPLFLVLTCFHLIIMYRMGQKQAYFNYFKTTFRYFLIFSFQTLIVRLALTQDHYWCEIEGNLSEGIRFLGENSRKVLKSAKKLT